MTLQEQERRAATPSDDRTLIELCNRAEAIGIRIDAALAEMTDEIETSGGLRPLYDQIDDLDDKIMALQAHTLAGLRAKARRVLWCAGGTLSIPTLEGMDQQLAFHVIRDLLLTF